MKTLVSTLLVVLFIVVLPVIAAHAGVFREDFSDENLDRWHIEIDPGPPVTDFLNFENEYLVIETVHRVHPSVVSLELRTVDPEKWDSYTLTCRIRFKSLLDLEPPSTFGIGVRYSEGHLVQIGPHEFASLYNIQMMRIHHDRLQKLSVSTSRRTRLPGKGPQVIGIPHAKLQLERLARPIWDRWIPIKIVAKEELFEFYFDNHLVAQYEDEKAEPGTVTFWSQSRLSVHLDDIVISGPRIPSIGPRSVEPELNSVTTWGEIKNSPRTRR